MSCPQDLKTDQVLETGKIFSGSVISSYEDLDLSLNDDLNCQHRNQKLRNSDFADDHSQRSSYDFLNPEPQKYLGVHQSKIIRCISPLPLHKTLSSDGNIIFEPMLMEDTHSFGPNAEELEKVENYLSEKKKNLEILENFDTQGGDTAALSEKKKNLKILENFDTQVGDTAALDSPVNLLVQTFDEPLKNPGPSLKLSPPFMSSKSEEVLFTPTLEGKVDLSETGLQINPMTNLDIEIFSFPETPRLGEKKIEEISSKTLENLLNDSKKNSLSLDDLPKLSIVPCKTLSQNELTLISDISFTCGSPQLRRDGFFAKKFIEYQVAVPSLGWSVKRRYNDFSWLRTALATSNPGSYIPPVPPKKPTGNFSENFIKKRQKMLNKYLSSILRDPVLRSSPETLVFFKENDEALLIKHQKSRILKKIESFDEIQNIEGETFCDFSQDSSFFRCFGDYLEVSADLEQKFKDISKKLVISSKKVSRSVQELADIVGELVEVQEILPKNVSNSKVLENAQNSLNRWATHEEIAANNLESDFKYHYYYKVKEKNILKMMLEEREYRRKVFLKSGKKDLEHIKNAKLLYGHFNFKIFNELERVLGDQVIYDVQHLKNVALNEISKTTTLESLWKTISDSFFVNRKLFRYG
jgi:hypothetical protein